SRTGRCKLSAGAVVADCIGPPRTSSLQYIGLAPAGALDSALRQTVIPFRYVEHDPPRLGVGHDFGNGPRFFGAAQPVFGVIEQSLHGHTSAADRILSPIPGAVIKIALHFAAGMSAL